jgi:chromosome partitioning protein
MSQVIAITNQKGGVGKTTTSVNFAAGLARKGKKTLILDLDPQGHASEHLGVEIIEENKEQKTILRTLEKETSISGSTYPTYIPNLWISPSNIHLGKFNQHTPAGNQFILKESLVEIADKFDFIIIDCQPSLSLLTLNALTASDYVLLPVQSEYLALDGLTQLVVTLHEIQTKLHPKLKVLGILLTMFDRRNRLSGEVRAELRKNFGEDLFHTTIPRSVKLAEAPSFGKAIFDYDGNSVGSQAYTDLVREVLDKLKLINK